MAIPYVSDAVDLSYNVIKYAASRPKKALAILGIGSLTLLVACGGDKEATPLEVATSTQPSEHEATVQAKSPLATLYDGIVDVPVHHNVDDFIQSLEEKLLPEELRYGPRPKP